MNKQVEELKNDISYELGISYEEERLPFSLHTRDYLAKALIEKGYQKIDKDSVVLSREEYDNLKLEIQKAHNKGVRVGFDLTKYKENSIEQARKETAREIIEMFSDKNYITEKDLIKAIAKRYGVEIKNG